MWLVRRYIMEAKDTVMSDEQIEQCCRNGFVWYPIVSTADRNIAKAQAEISFKAGIKEVVEWIKLNKFHVDGFPCYDYQGWEAKLKDWHISK